MPPVCYLVGGTVRDAGLGRERSQFDLDLVVPHGAIAVARKLARQYQAGFVTLDAEREIARVVFAEGTVDFARQEGDSLTQDLKRRDYTINAIAYDLQQKILIDPLGGQDDLQAQVLRAISFENLQADPLRLLRAYRQAAQLGFSIEPTTRSWLQHLSGALAQVAAERVQAELNYLLDCPVGTPWLEAAISDGVLTSWLGAVSSTQLAQLRLVDTQYRQQSRRWSAFSENPGWVFSAKLAALLAPEADSAIRTLQTLKYARAEIKAIGSALKHLPSLRRELDLTEQYFLFRGLGNYFPIAALLMPMSNLPTGETLLQRYFDPTDPVVHPRPLVTGHDLLQALPLKRGPLIGELLTAIQIAQINGKLHSPEDAIAFGVEYLDQNPTQ
ncbi:MAG: CCA tRNA nucleotidyltransferase [Cyanobacteria bacterium P01_H01_bin.15]